MCVYCVTYFSRSQNIFQEQKYLEHIQIVECEFEQKNKKQNQARVVF